MNSVISVNCYHVCSYYTKLFVIIFYHQLQMVKTILPYHQLMTPKWIVKNAVITTPYALYSKYFEILPTTGASYQRALQFQLVAPKILKSTDSIAVTVTVAVDTSITNVDHDLTIGISDGQSFYGFIAHEQTSRVCDVFEGDSNTSTLKNVAQVISPTVTSKRYSSEIKIQFKPAEKWGSCHTERDEGYTFIGNYRRSFNPSNGVYFEVYHHNAAEKYRIKYIVVDVDLD